MNDLSKYYYLLHRDFLDLGFEEQDHIRAFRQDMDLPLCHAISNLGWICVRKPGHDGDHLATFVDGEIIQAWPGDYNIDEITSLLATVGSYYYTIRKHLKKQFRKYLEYTCKIGLRDGLTRCFTEHPWEKYTDVQCTRQALHDGPCISMDDDRKAVFIWWNRNS